MRIAIIEPLPFGGLLHYAVQLGDALAERGNTVDLVLAREHELTAHAGPARRRAILPPDAAPAPPNPTRVQMKLRRARTAARLATTWRLIQRRRARCRWSALRRSCSSVCSEAGRLPKCARHA